MEVKLGDSEIKVMDVLWKEGDVPAKYVADLLNERYGWNINTTYTLLKRCIKKGVVELQRAKLYLPCASFQIVRSTTRNCQIDQKSF